MISLEFHKMFRVSKIVHKFVKIPGIQTMLAVSSFVRVSKKCSFFLNLFWKIVHGFPIFLFNFFWIFKNLFMLLLNIVVYQIYSFKNCFDFPKIVCSVQRMFVVFEIFCFGIFVEFSKICSCFWKNVRVLLIFFLVLKNYFST